MTRIGNVGTTSLLFDYSVTASSAHVKAEGQGRSGTEAVGSGRIRQLYSFRHCRDRRIKTSGECIGGW